MSVQMLSVRLWDDEAIAGLASATSDAIEIGKASAMALHILAITGTALDVTFTYKLSNSRGGTYITPASPVTIGANISAVDVLDFAPEAAGFIKIIATNNHASNVATLTAQLAVQEI